MTDVFNLPGISNNKATEHRSDSSTRSSHSHSGGSCSNEFSSGVNVTAHSASLESPHSHLLLGGYSTLRCQE